MTTTSTPADTAVAGPETALDTAPEPDATEPAGPRPSLWRTGSYWAWLASDTGQALGSSLQFFLVPLLVVLVSGNAAAAGTVAALGLGGRLATTLLGGVLADRHDLRRLMILSGTLAGCVMLGLVAVVGLDLGLVALGALNLLAGVRAGLLGNASDAALKQVVPPSLLPTASSANQARDAAVSMGAPPLGGLLLGLGAVPALLTAAAAYLVSALGALVLRGDFRPAPANGKTSIRAEVGAGLAWLWQALRAAPRHGRRAPAQPRSQRRDRDPALLARRRR